MIDHVVLEVSDLDRSRGFYERALAPVGYELVYDDHGFVGFGVRTDGRIDFFLAARGAAAGPVHLAFEAADRAGVDAFHAAALAAGGTDNGPPGTRPVYHEHYYGGYVLDPDGNNVEAVCHAAPPA